MLLYIYSASVKNDSFGKLRSTATDLEKRLAGSAPRGWKLRGIYFTSFGLGKNQVELHWDVDSYAAFDAASHDHASGGDFSKAVEHVVEHVDLGSQRARVLRPASATVTTAAGAKSLCF